MTTPGMKQVGVFKATAAAVLGMLLVIVLLVFGPRPLKSANRIDRPAAESTLPGTVQANGEKGSVFDELCSDARIHCPPFETKVSIGVCETARRLLEEHRKNPHRIDKPPGWPELTAPASSASSSVEAAGVARRATASSVLFSAADVDKRSEHAESASIRWNTEGNVQISGFAWRLRGRESNSEQMQASDVAGVHNLAGSPSRQLQTAGSSSSSETTASTGDTSQPISYTRQNVTFYLNNTISGRVEQDTLPLLTRGRWVTDSQNNRVNLRCVNWYGPHMGHAHVNGLNAQPLDVIAQIIVEADFNCVRLTYSLDLVYNQTRIGNPSDQLAKNRELWDLSPMQIFDRTVEALTRKKIMVFLNNHISSAGWCCDNDDGEGLWYTQKYSERDWINGLLLLSQRYANNRYVVGHDIRNEIRPSMGKDPVWFSKDRFEAWAPAALRASLEMKKAVPHQLIIVSALYYGMFMCDVDEFPVHELVPGSIVYAAHAYKWYSIRWHVRTMIEVYLSSFVAFLVLSWMFVLYLGLQTRYCPNNCFTRLLTRSLRFCCKRRRRLGASSRRSDRTSKMSTPSNYDAGDAENKNVDGVLERCCHFIKYNRVVSLAGFLTFSVPIMAWTSAIVGEICSIHARATAMVLFIFASAVAGVSALLWFVVFVRGMIEYGPLLNEEASTSRLRQLLQSPNSPTGANADSGAEGSDSEHSSQHNLSMLRSPLEMVKQERRREKRWSRKLKRRERRRLRREAASRGEILLSPEISSSEDDSSDEEGWRHSSAELDVYPRPMVGAPVSGTYSRGSPLYPPPTSSGGSSFLATAFSDQKPLTTGRSVRGAPKPSKVVLNQQRGITPPSTRSSSFTEQTALQQHRGGTRSGRLLQPAPVGGPRIRGRSTPLQRALNAPPLHRDISGQQTSSGSLRRTFSDTTGGVRLQVIRKIPSRNALQQQPQPAENPPALAPTLQRKQKAKRKKRSEGEANAPEDEKLSPHATVSESEHGGSSSRDGENFTTSNTPLAPQPDEFRLKLREASLGLKRSFQEMGVAMSSEEPTPEVHSLIGHEGGHYNIVPSSSSSAEPGPTRLAGVRGRVDPHIAPQVGNQAFISRDNSKTSSQNMRAEGSSASASSSAQETHDFHSLSEEELEMEEEPSFRAVVMESPDVAAGVPASNSRHPDFQRRLQFNAEGDHQTEFPAATGGEEVAVEEGRDDQQLLSQQSMSGVRLDENRGPSQIPIPLGDELAFENCASSSEADPGSAGKRHAEEMGVDTTGTRFAGAENLMFAHHDHRVPQAEGENIPPSIPGHDRWTRTTTMTRPRSIVTNNYNRATYSDPAVWQFQFHNTRNAGDSSLSNSSRSVYSTSEQPSAIRHNDNSPLSINIDGASSISPAGTTNAGRANPGLTILSGTSAISAVPPGTTAGAAAPGSTRSTSMRNSLFAAAKPPGGAKKSVQFQEQPLTPPPPSAFRYSADRFVQKRSRQSVVPPALFGGSELADLKLREQAGKCAPRISTRCGWLRRCIRFRWYHWFLILLIVMVFTLAMIYSYLGSYERFADELDKNWGFLLHNGRAPVWLNEFGTGNPGSWWRNMMRYINENRVDFAYWSIDGQKEPGREETYGLLEMWYDEYRYLSKMLDLSPHFDYQTRNGRIFPLAVVQYNDNHGILPPWDGFYDGQ
ncbi:unnamed protein product [Amoebophrya sp. A120]|nr:unnamed protein product [Amoebophrya sp. A120]|eukprot:GSA120T00002972001.1